MLIRRVQSIPNTQISNLETRKLRTKPTDLDHIRHKIAKLNLYYCIHTVLIVKSMEQALTALQFHSNFLKNISPNHSQ